MIYNLIGLERGLIGFNGNSTIYPPVFCQFVIFCLKMGYLILPQNPLVNHQFCINLAFWVICSTVYPNFGYTQIIVFLISWVCVL